MNRNLLKSIQFVFLYFLLFVNGCIVFVSSFSDSFEAPNFGESYWDVKVALQQDYIIIGAGIVGLSTAIEIKKARPNSRVLVLEKGTLASGASTRNAGFACFGSLTEICEDISLMGPKAAINQVSERWEGLKLLREELGDQAIGFRQTGNYELISPSLLEYLPNISVVNEQLYPIFGNDVFIHVNDEKILEFGFSKKHVAALVFNRFEGQINSGMMMEALQKRALSLGVIIRYGSRAEKPYKSGEHIYVPVLSEHINGKRLIFRVNAVALCVNGFISELFSKTDIKPGRGQIIVTAPLNNISIPKILFHMDRGFWYFRVLDDNRILVGGGRNLDFNGETTTVLKTTQKIITSLKDILFSVIIPGVDYTIDYEWSGIMAFSSSHAPIIESVPVLSNVVIGFGCNGMGIARGYNTGKRTAALLLKVSS